MNQTWIVDAHCHWSDERLFADAAVEIPRMLAAGVRGFQLGGVDPAEWARQDELQVLFPGKFWRAFGLHPYFVAAQGEDHLQAAWEKLLLSAPSLEAIGETGLDFRKAYLAHGKDRQIQYFDAHLRLAKTLAKPVILHIVRAHEEALYALKNHSARGMVHAFTAGPRVAKRYLELGLHLSIGAKLLHPETHDLAETVRAAPLEKLLIESDCPDQPPPGQKAHDSTTVWAIAEKIAELKKLPFSRVVEQTRANLLDLINKEPSR